MVSRATSVPAISAPTPSSAEAESPAAASSEVPAADQSSVGEASVEKKVDTAVTEPVEPVEKAVVKEQVSSEMEVIKREPTPVVERMEEVQETAEDKIEPGGPVSLPTEHLKAGEDELVELSAEPVTDVPVPEKVEVKTPRRGRPRLKRPKEEMEVLTEGTTPSRASSPGSVKRTASPSPEVVIPFFSVY